MPGSITPKGTGYPDHRRRLFGTVSVSVRGGSVDISGTIEHILAVGTLRYIGTVQRVGRIGTVQRIGTVRYIQAGSFGYAGQLGTLNTRAQSRKSLLGTTRLHSASGSTYIGSWEEVSRYRTKTYGINASQGGSLFIIGGMLGTGPSSLTGTAYRSRIGAGTFVTNSFTEQFQFTRAIVRSGSFGSGKGTIRLARAFQA